MAGSYESNLNNFLQDRVCTFLGNGHNFWGAYDAATDGYIENYDLGGEAIAGVYQDWYRRFCNREPPPPPREGGECPIGYGINCTYATYLLNGQFVDRVTQTSDCNFAPFIYGPVGGARIFRNGTFMGYEVSGYDAEGNPVTAGITGQVNNEFYRDIVIESLEFYPCNPSEAICERDPIPSNEVEFPVRLPDINFSWDGDNNTSYDFSATVLVGSPQVNLSGDFRFPVTLTFGPNTLNFSPEIRFEFGSGLDGGGGTSPPPPPPPRTRNPIENIERDQNDEEPPPPPPPPPGSQIVLREGRVFLGMLVVSDPDNASGISTIFQNSNPDIYVPALGYLNFWVKVGDREAWSGDIPIKNTYQFVNAPDPLRTIAAYGTPKPGVDMKFFPVYITMEEYLGYSVVNSNP